VIFFYRDFVLIGKFSVDTSSSNVDPSPSVGSNLGGSMIAHDLNPYFFLFATIITLAATRTYCCNINYYYHYYIAIIIMCIIIIIIIIILYYYIIIVLLLYYYYYIIIIINP